MSDHLSFSDSKEIQPWDPDCDCAITILEQHGLTLTPPSDAQLLTAPFIESWAVTHIGDLPLLVGATYGVPGSRDGMVSFTSPVIHISEESGWAKTVGGFYRLGDRWTGVRS